MKRKKLLSLALVITLLLALFAGCKPKPVDALTGADDDNTSPSSAPITSDVSARPTIYETAKLPIPFDPFALEMAEADPTRRQIYVYLDGRVYLERYSDIKENGDIVGQLMGVVSVNLDGENEQLVWMHEVMFDDPNAKVQTFTTLHTYSIDDDGNPWILLQYETQDSTDELAPTTTYSYEIFKYTANGELVGSTDIGAVVEKPRIRPDSRIVFDNDGNAYLSIIDRSTAEDIIAVYVFSGETAEFVCRGRWIQCYGMFRTRDGDAGYVFNANGYMDIGVHTLSNGTLTEKTYKHSFEYNYFEAFRGYGPFDALLYDGIKNVVYGYNFETQESVKLIDFAASEIATPRMPDAPSSFNYLCLGSLVALGDNEFLLSLGAEGLFKVTPSNALPTEKVTLTIGVVGADALLAPAVQQFNAQSKTTRIEIKDYTNSGSRTAEEAVAQFDLDVLRGQGPDIIRLSSMSPGKYINKGILADLTELFDNDSNVKREDLFENVLDLGKTGDKLYHVITHFAPMMLVGKTSVLGQPGEITVDKITSALAKYPTAQLLLDTPATSWVSLCSQLLLDEFVDWETGKCDFNNATFIALLNSATRMPPGVYEQTAASDAETHERLKAQFIKDVADNKILASVPVMLGLRSARLMRELFGEEMAFLGFPSSSSGSGNVLSPLMDLAILEASTHKTEAWEFISFLMQDGFEQTEGDSSILTNRSVFEARAAEEMTPMADRREAMVFEITPTSFWAIGVVSGDDLKDPRWADYHLTAEEIAMQRQAIEGITRLASTDVMIYTIITEETDAFLNSNRSAEETARIIQSRVGLYVAENS